MTEQLLLSEKSLARKWGISHKTLQRWRWLKTGPAYIKIGGRIRYSTDSIKEYEDSNLHQAPTTPTSGVSTSIA
jgi:predicted DNA-binding transcriptional regulator AlpA